MKTSFWDRVLMFLYVLITLAFCLCMALRAFGIDLIGALFAGLESAAGHFLFLLIALGLTAIVALLSVYMLLMIFQRGKRRPPEPFIGVIAGDGGQVRIALPAIAQMARQAIGKTPGVRDMSVDVTQEDDAISVSIALTLEAGAQVPVVTQNMQRAVRKSLESSCGVAVRDVQITVSAIAQDAADTPKKAKQPLWRRRREEAALPSAAQETPLQAAPAQETAGASLETAETDGAFEAGFETESESGDAEALFDGEICAEEEKAGRAQTDEEE